MSLRAKRSNPEPQTKTRLLRRFAPRNDGLLKRSFFMLNTLRLFVMTLAISIATIAIAADNKAHRLAIQVDQNDPQVMNLALNNATNVLEYYRGKNEDVDVDIVTYGPGLHMLRAD